MNRLLILGIGLVVAFIAALIFEDSRDWLAEAWDYVISFEWFGDIWDFVTGMFENLSEFSITGLVFGVLVVIFIYLLRDYMLTPFLLHMGPLTAMFWNIATYVVCAIVGYMVGKRLFDD